MKKLIITVSIVVLGLVSPVFASNDPLEKGIEGAVETFAEGCQNELTTFCKDVTPGEGRLLACLYAFEDKVSVRCQYALYDSIYQLNRTLANASYAIEECGDDLQANCTEIKPGEGRLLDCLQRNEAKVSSRCKQALKDIGWK